MKCYCDLMFFSRLCSSSKGLKFMQRIEVYNIKIEQTAKNYWKFDRQYKIAKISCNPQKRVQKFSNTGKLNLTKFRTQKNKRIISVYIFIFAYSSLRDASWYTSANSPGNAFRNVSGNVSIVFKFFLLQ